MKKLANVFAFDKSISKVKAQYEDVSTVNKYLDGIDYKDLTVKCAVLDESKNNICNTKFDCIEDVNKVRKVRNFIAKNGICRIQIDRENHYFEAVIYKDPANKSTNYITFLDRGAPFWEGDDRHKTYQVDRDKLGELLTNMKGWRNLPARNNEGSELKTEQTKTVEDALQEIVGKDNILSVVPDQEEPVFMEFTKGIKTMKTGKCVHGNQELGIRAVMHYLDFKDRRQNPDYTSKLESNEVK